MISKDSFPEFVSWAFYSVVTGIAVYAVAILGDMNKNINELNTKIAVVMEKNSHYEYRFQAIEQKLNK